jgi:hypothetical protein
MKLFAALFLVSTLANAQAITDIEIFGYPKAESHVPLTFGQVFNEGDLPAGYSVTLLNKTSNIPTQLDVKATHKDGSVRHGVISAIIPFLPAGTTKLVIYKIKMIDVSLMPVYKQVIFK